MSHDNSPFWNREGLWDENNHQLLVHFMIHTPPITVALWRKERVLILSHLVKKSKYISRRWHSFFHSSFLLLQRAYQTFPENRDRVVFLYWIFLIHTDLFSIFLIFFRKPKVTKRIPQLLLVVQEKESPFLVSFIFHVWEHDFIVQVASCCISDFHFLFSFRWRLRQTQTSVTRWIDGTWSLCKQKYFSVSFF